MRNVTLDCRAIPNRETLHSTLAAALAERIPNLI